MQRCVLMILFAFSLLFETHGVCHYSYNVTFLKTCEFCFKFISEHGITGGINRKLAKATASANTYLHPTTTRKPIVYDRRAAGTGATKKAETKSIQKEEPKVRVEATRIDANKYLSGLTGQNGILSQKGVTTDGHEYYRFERKCEYMGQKFKKGEYISRDTLHHEWEYFQDKDTHLGAIDPLTGKMKPKSRVKWRKLNVK